VEQSEVDQMSHVQFCQDKEDSATTIVNYIMKCDRPNDQTLMQLNNQVLLLYESCKYGCASWLITTRLTQRITNRIADKDKVKRIAMLFREKKRAFHCLSIVTHKCKM